MKTRLIFLFLFAALMSVALPAAAQKSHGENWRKEMREFKLKFLAQEMALQADQQKQFFTLYTQMSDEKDALMRNTRQSVERVDKMSQPTDADYRAATEAMRNAREQEVAIDRKYEEKFRAFLSPKQIYKLQEAERKFRDKLTEMRHQRQHGKQKNKK